MIRTLEKEYGFPLLLRTPDGVVPTQDALRVIPYIRNILHNENCLYEETNRIRQIEVGSIHLGTYVSVMTSFLPALIRNFANLHPSIELSLVEGNTVELNDFLKKRSVDFAFVTRLGFEEFEFIPLLKDELMVTLPEGHPLSACEIVDPHDLFKYPIISTEENSEHDLIKISQLAEAAPNIRMRAKIETSILALVAGGIGAAIIPSLYLRNPRKGIVIRKLDSPHRYREVGIAAVSLHALSPASREFIDSIPADFETFFRDISTR